MRSTEERSLACRRWMPATIWAAEMKPSTAGGRGRLERRCIRAQHSSAVRISRLWHTASRQQAVAGAVYCGGLAHLGWESRLRAPLGGCPRQPAPGAPPAAAGGSPARRSRTCRDSQQYRRYGLVRKQLVNGRRHRGGAAGSWWLAGVRIGEKSQQPRQRRQFAAAHILRSDLRPRGESKLSSDMSSPLAARLSPRVSAPRDCRRRATAAAKRRSPPAGWEGGRRWV